jgi:hypothetical protein
MLEGLIIDLGEELVKRINSLGLERLLKPVANDSWTGT